MAVISLVVAGVVWSGFWVRKLMHEDVSKNVSKFFSRCFWIVIHFVILVNVMIEAVKGSLDGAIAAMTIGAWNEVVARVGVAILILVAYNWIFDAAMGFVGIKKEDFGVYLKDADRLLTYLMNLLAVLGFFYPAIGIDGQRESRELLVLALTAFFDMIALDAYKILLRPLGVGIWVDGKIRTQFDRMAHDLWVKVQDFLHHKKEKPLSNEENGEGELKKS